MGQKTDFGQAPKGYVAGVGAYDPFVLLLASSWQDVMSFPQAKTELALTHAVPTLRPVQGEAMVDGGAPQGGSMPMCQEGVRRGADVGARRAAPAPRRAKCREFGRSAWLRYRAAVYCCSEGRRGSLPHRQTVACLP